MDPNPEDVSGNLEAARQAAMRKALQQLLDHCDVADGEDGKLSTTAVRRICWTALGERP